MVNLGAGNALGMPILVPNLNRSHHEATPSKPSSSCCRIGDTRGLGPRPERIQGRALAFTPLTPPPLNPLHLAPLRHRQRDRPRDVVHRIQPHALVDAMDLLRIRPETRHRRPLVQREEPPIRQPRRRIVPQRPAGHVRNTPPRRPHDPIPAGKKCPHAIGKAPPRATAIP